MTRRAALLALGLFTSLLSCGREVTGPGGRGALVDLQFEPTFPQAVDEVDGILHNVSALVPFTRVRIELRRVDNTIASAQVVEFPPSATQVPMGIQVRLGPAAQNGAEPLTARIRYINAAGDTVFAGGPVSVIARSGRGGQQTPVEIPILPTVPGAIFARIDINPDTVIANSGQTAAFTATGFDGQNNVVPNAIIGFISRNPALVAVPNLGSGNVSLVGARGSTWLVAQSLTGVRDSAFISVRPVPATLTRVSGNGQSALQGQAFAQPLRVRVVASDGLGVANWPVQFAVTTGGGLVSAPNVLTDSTGHAEVTWTAGAVLGAASVTASVTSPALSVVFNGTQLSSDAASLAFVSQPANITAGEALPSVAVEVRNASGAVMPEFTGAVTLGLAGGNPAASLVGATSVNAVAGVATFSGLTVNRGGTGYRLVAQLDTLPPVQSSLFDAADAPPTTLTLLGGGGQSAPAATELADSIRVRVTDTFGFPVPQRNVQFSVDQGGGSVSASSVETDADGRAAVAWILGSSGVQQLKVTLGTLEQTVTATLVASGEVRLFVGVDYSSVIVGGQRSIPVFLTLPSPTPIDLTLSVDDTSGTKLQWPTPTAQIPAGVTRLDLPIEGLAPGFGWVFVRSAVGDDSVLVAVDSAALRFVSPSFNSFVTGDTIRTYIQLSDPAPVGGVTVIVRSSDPTKVALAPGAGTGVPQPGCIGWACYGGGGDFAAAGLDLAPGGPLALKADPADTAAVFIPEGQVFGEVAVVILEASGGSSVSLLAEADNFVSGEVFLTLMSQFLSPTYDWYADPSLGVPVDHQFALDFWVSATRPRAQRIHLESSNPAVLTVPDSTVIEPFNNSAVTVYPRIVTADTAWVRYWTDNVAPDSILVVGTVGQLAVDGSTSLAEGGEMEVSVRVINPSNPTAWFAAAQPIPVALGSDNEAILTLERAGAVIEVGQSSAWVKARMVGQGTANVTASSPGRLSASLPISSMLGWIWLYGGNYVGVDQLLTAYVEVSTGPVSAEPRSLSVQSLNTEFLRVITPTVTVPRGNFGTEIRLRGVAPGTATIRLSGPGFPPTDFQILVSPLAPSLSVNSNLPPDGVERSVSTALWDGFATRPMAVPAQAILRSSNPAVLVVTDSIVNFLPGAQNGTGGRYRPLAPGEATLSLLYGADSVGRPVTVRPYGLFANFQNIVVGQRMQAFFTLVREGPDTLSLPITVTHSGAGFVGIEDLQESFSAGQFSVTGRIVGETVGADTLTFSVPGYPDVRQTVFVQPTQVTLYQYEEGFAAGVLDEYVKTALIISGGSPSFTPARALRFRIASLDTAMVEVVQDTVEWDEGFQFSPSRYATLRYKRPGFAPIAVTDLDGVLPGDTTEIFIQPADLIGSLDYADNILVLGMGQVSDEWETYVSRGRVSADTLRVFLTSSNPDLVQVPASVLIEPNQFYGFFPVTAGDTTGSARVMATAVGYNPWEFDVLVTRSRFEMYLDDTYTDEGGRGEVYIVDAMSYTSRVLANDVPARFSTTTPDFVDTQESDFTFPAGTQYLSRRGPVGRAPGRANVRVEDSRGESAFDHVLPGSFETIVETARIESEVSRITLVPGFISANSSQRVRTYTGRDSIRMAITPLRGLFAPQEDTVLVTRPSGWYGDGQSASYSSPSFPMRGISLGTDTLVYSADGLRPDTVIVTVDRGILNVVGELPIVYVGDSLLVTLRLLDPTGSFAAAAESLNIGFSVDTNFTLRKNDVQLTTGIPVNAGEFTAQFWLRAENSGSSTIGFSHPSFRSLNVVVTAAERP